MEEGRKIFSVVQTTTGKPCAVSAEIRWEMQKKKPLICQEKFTKIEISESMFF